MWKSPLRFAPGTPARLAMTIADAELREILAGMRELAGTNPTMATGGFTGRRGGAAAPGRGGGPAAAPVSAAPAAATP